MKVYILIRLDATTKNDFEDFGLVTTCKQELVDIWMEEERDGWHGKKNRWPIIRIGEFELTEITQPETVAIDRENIAITLRWV